MIRFTSPALLLLLVALVIRPGPTHTQLQNEDVHLMVKMLSEAFLTEACTVFGAGDEVTCGFMDAKYPSPEQIVSLLVDPLYGEPLYDYTELDVTGMLSTWAVGVNSSADVNSALNETGGGLRELIVSKSALVERLASRAEELYKEHRPLTSGDVLFNESRVGSDQSTWTATYVNDTSSEFYGHMIDSDKCAFHLPATVQEDGARVDADVTFLHGMCGPMRDNLASQSVADLSFQFISTPSGVAMNYPASPLGLEYDGRLDDWYRGSTLPPKDIVFVVDQSGSMEGGKRCGKMSAAVAQVDALVQTLVTEHDSVSIMLAAETPIFSPCYGAALVPGSDERIQVLLSWLHSASATRGGEGILAKGIQIGLQLVFASDKPERAKFVVVVSDNVNAQDSDETFKESLEQFFAGMVPPVELPSPAVHFIGMSVTSKPGATTMDLGACLQLGLSWKIHNPDALNADKCSLQAKNLKARDRDSIPFPLDPRLLMNITDLSALAAWPWSQRSLPFWTLPRRSVDGGGMVTVGKAIFDRSTKIPRLLGAVGVDFHVDAWINRVKASVQLPDLMQIFLLQHQDFPGATLVHTGQIPEYPNFREFETILNQLAVDLTVIEGKTFKEAGVLLRMVTEDKGPVTLDRELVLDLDWTPHRDDKLQHLVRRDVQRVTYWWIRIPDTMYTIGAVVYGEPIPRTNLMLVPYLRAPSPCPKHVEYPYVELTDPVKTYGCWQPHSASLPTVYHRLDLLSDVLLGEGVRFGVCGQWCTYDLSTWTAAPSAYLNAELAATSPETKQIAQDLSAIALAGQTQEAGVQAAAGEGSPGAIWGGLRDLAVNELRVTANFEAFWKRALRLAQAAAGKDGSGIVRLFVLTRHGILRGYPGDVFERDDGTMEKNMMRKPWYTRALADPDMIAATNPYNPDRDNSSEWFITLSKAVRFVSKNRRNVQAYGSTRGPALFGVVGAHYKFSHFVSFFRRATTLRAISKYGCGDMLTSKVADAGLGCWLLDSNANVIMDRKLMQLASTPSSQLNYDPSLYNFYSLEPMLMQHLFTYQVFTKNKVSLILNEHVIYQLNQSALEEWTRINNQELRQKGLPEVEYKGISFTVQDNSGRFATNKIWLYQVPGVALYILVVVGYDPLTTKPYCGPLSQGCPDVFLPVDTTISLHTCGEQAVGLQNLTSAQKYVAPTEADMKDLRTWSHKAGLKNQYMLECAEPVLGPMGIGLIAGAAVVLVLLSPLVWFFVRRRLKVRRTMAHLSSRGSSTLSPVVAKGSLDGEEAGQIIHRGYRIDAVLQDYKVLSESQWQLVEDLHKRDEGDLQALRAELGTINLEVSQIMKQLDYLQQRMQKQELISPKYERLRRRATNLTDSAKMVMEEVDDARKGGMLPGLDPALETEMTDLSLTAGGQLPRGTREAMFHKIYFPHVVAGIQQERLDSRHVLEEDSDAHDDYNDDTVVT